MASGATNALNFLFKFELFLFHTSEYRIIRTGPCSFADNFLVKKAVFLGEFLKMTFERHPFSSVHCF